MCADVKLVHFSQRKFTIHAMDHDNENNYEK